MSAPSPAPFAPRLRASLVALIVLAAVAGTRAPPARALDVQSEAAVQSSKSLGDYLDDLEDESDPDRLFAARVLQGELARALRTVDRAPEGSLAWLDARALLLELEERLPRACTAAVRFRNTVAPCADILARLEVTTALPALREVRTLETRRAVTKRLDAAIAALEARVPPAPPPAPPAVAAPPPPAPPAPASPAAPPAPAGAP
jgi:hypothetical protein